MIKAHTAQVRIKAPEFKKNRFAILIGSAKTVHKSTIKCQTNSY